MCFEKFIHTTSSFPDMTLSPTPEAYIKETQYTAIFER